LSFASNALGCQLRRPLEIAAVSSKGFALAWPMSNHDRRMLRYIINFIYPPRCAACSVRMDLDADVTVCPACIAAIERIPEPVCQVCGIPLQQVADTGSGWCRACIESPPHFSRARAVARYRPGMSEDGQIVPSIIRRHKYGRDQSLSRALAQCLGEQLPLNGHDYDLVIPVPLHRRRLRWRGFNQAALLGVTVARRMGCALDLACLARVRDTPPQTMQQGAERRHNVRGAFVVTRRERIANRRLLLVDDVMTTGATLDECARTLLAAGARRVDVFTVARAV
jgi:ComF family protein